MNKIFIFIVSLVIFLQSSDSYGTTGHQCRCIDGEQIPCDESANPLGPNQCTTNCDCTIGRHCSHWGWCEDNRHHHPFHHLHHHAHN